MPRIAPLVVALALFIGPAAASAGLPIPIALTAPAGLTAQACSTPVWQGASAVWKGVVDKRPSPEIGLQMQKNKEPIPLVADPPLPQLFDRALRELLPACGMKLMSDGGADALSLSAEIREFHAGVEKKLLTGASNARSSIAFVGMRGGRSTSVTVGYEIDAKRIRSGDIKQLQRALNELFAETLKQIPATPDMRDLK